MQNPLAALFRSVVKLLCAIPLNLSRTSQNRARLSRAQSRDKQAVNAVSMIPSTPPPPSLSPEQFHRMLAEVLAADPDLVRRVLLPLSGTVRVPPTLRRSLASIPQGGTAT